jgi:Anti-sigma-K factor rskA, C-terminal
VNREPDLNELVGTEVSGEERERLQHVHELLLRSGPPAELTPELEAGPTLATTLGRRPRHHRRRAMLLLAAALAVVLVFLAGYVAANHQTTNGPPPVKVFELKGTPLAPTAEATLQVWQERNGNWPMTLNAVGLSQLPPGTYYEVFLVRNGKPWGSCGTFRVSNTNSASPVTVTLTAPYTLQNGDSWVVTRQGIGGREPGQTVLRPVVPA